MVLIALSQQLACDASAGTAAIEPLVLGGSGAAARGSTVESGEGRSVGGSSARVEIAGGVASSGANQASTIRLNTGLPSNGGANTGATATIAYSGGGLGVPMTHSSAGGVVTTRATSSSSPASSCRADAETVRLDDAEYAQNCVACSGNDQCLQCICTHCTHQVRICADTSGCMDISACVQDSHCTGVDCYCGSHDALSCALGQADGPCRDEMLNAPSGRVPTLASPSAGPASDAAVAVASCLDKEAAECKPLCQ